MAETKPIAVLTGDLVGSSRLDPASFESVRDNVQASAAAITGWPGAAPLGTLEFFRGDSWQFALAGPGHALRAAVMIRTRLRTMAAQTRDGATVHPDSRIAIAIGDAGTIDAARISQSIGDAFIASGRALDAMPTDRRIIVAAAEGDRTAQLYAATAGMFDMVMARWKPRQIDAVAARLTSPGVLQKTIAEALPTSQQALSKALVSVGWGALDDAMVLIEGAYRD